MKPKCKNMKSENIFILTIPKTKVKIRINIKQIIKILDMIYLKKKQEINEMYQQT